MRGNKLYCSDITLSAPVKPEAQAGWNTSFELYPTLADCGAGNVAKATRVSSAKTSYCSNKTLANGVLASTFVTCNSVRYLMWEYNNPGCPDADFAAVSSYANNQCLAASSTTDDSLINRCLIPGGVTPPDSPSSPFSAAIAVRPSLAALVSLMRVHVAAASLNLM
ncbi:uncharacterized protein EV422DRAFT_510028 [Fimicolochytrium jonesii]|uniref:uncharacterized protein n=1 Tax=Fimicolochytrium jonesii TaxID=1396493 RepID=UPI0022FE110D|nr:uncharacterized protein EV422DRAFT_510028 [Fimicolochytrium jonesii]KAI8816173.1 hypothetical protein EV422DRAFT_510028 [Fimicolochytrium jonesii]